MTDELRPLIDGLDFGEGPRWHDGRLWYSDFFGHHVAAVDLAGQHEVMVELDGALEDRPSGLGWLPDGRLLVVAMQRRAVLRQEPDGHLVVHADLSAVATADANDMVVATDGTAYVGNFGADMFGGERPSPADLAGVHPDGTVFTAARDLDFPNGSVITPDGRTLIVGESMGRRYRAFPIHDDGTLGDGWVWAELGDRSPDGCTMDADGAIWFADASGHHVVRVREGGEITHQIPTPDTAYACALGGAGGRTLFVLTAACVPTQDYVPGTGRIWTVAVDVPHAGRP